MEKEMKQPSPEEIVRRIRDIYAPNHFMADYFHIDIDEISCGSVTVSLKTEAAKHANHRGIIHGGVLTALADAVTGVTGASMGDMVVTLSMTMNFIKQAMPGDELKVKSHVVHHGHATMVIEAKMTNQSGCLITDILATMMIIGHFPEIPQKW